MDFFKKKMAKKDSKNCWDFKHCPEYAKENCIVFKLNAGDRCWEVMGLGIEKGFSYCVRCPWYIKTQKASS